MQVLVLAELVGAGGADSGARRVQVRGVRRVAGHEAQGEGAYVGTVAGEGNAPGQGLHVVFL